MLVKEVSNHGQMPENIYAPITGAYSMKEKFSWNAASADNTLDLLARSPTEIPSTFVNCPISTS
jgi:hypothetical protein